jgi:hypothetical protein
MFIKLFRVVFAIALTVFTLHNANAQNLDPALVMVKTLRLGSNLSSMSHAAIVKTQTYPMILYANPVSGKEIVNEELDKAILNHQDQWDRNLADSYASLLTGEEMTSITKQKAGSPYVSKLQAVQSQAGANMHNKSAGLLGTVVSEALNNAFSKVQKNMPPRESSPPH